MTIRLSCFKIYENERGFDEYSTHHEWDADFETAEEAIAYMVDKCGWSSGEHAFVFDVDVRE